MRTLYFLHSSIWASKWVCYLLYGKRFGFLIEWTWNCVRILKQLICWRDGGGAWCSLEKMHCIIGLCMVVGRRLGEPYQEGRDWCWKDGAWVDVQEAVGKFGGCQGESLFNWRNILCEVLAAQTDNLVMVVRDERWTKWCREKADDLTWQDECHTTLCCSEVDEVGRKLWIPWSLGQDFHVTSFQMTWAFPSSFLRYYFLEGYSSSPPYFNFLY